MSNLFNQALTPKKDLVFLGGTCNNDTWRQELIPLLTNVDYFNPVVKEYDDAAASREDFAKQQCTHMLYVITPEMKSFYSISEMTEDAVLNKRPVIICFLNPDDPSKKLFTKEQYRGFNLVANLIGKYPCVIFCDNLQEIANVLNHGKKLL